MQLTVLGLIPVHLLALDHILAQNLGHLRRVLNTLVDTAVFGIEALLASELVSDPALRSNEDGSVACSMVSRVSCRHTLSDKSE